MIPFLFQESKNRRNKMVSSICLLIFRSKEPICFVMFSYIWVMTWIVDQLNMHLLNPFAIFQLGLMKFSVRKYNYDLLMCRNHRGLRHYWGLRVRGQHTKTTGRRGKTVGVSKKRWVFILQAENFPSQFFFLCFSWFRDSQCWDDFLTPFFLLCHHCLRKFIVVLYYATIVLSGLINIYLHSICNHCLVNRYFQ